MGFTCSAWLSQYYYLRDWKYDCKCWEEHDMNIYILTAFILRHYRLWCINHIYKILVSSDVFANLSHQIYTNCDMDKYRNGHLFRLLGYSRPYILLSACTLLLEDGSHTLRLFKLLECLWQLLGLYDTEHLDRPIYYFTSFTIHSSINASEGFEAGANTYLHARRIVSI